MLKIVLIFVVGFFVAVSVVGFLVGVFRGPKTTIDLVSIEKEPNKNKGIMSGAPITFDSFKGQPNATELLKTHVIASKITNKVVPHIMLEGPGGTGKTTLALCVANEVDTNLYVTTPSTFKDKDAVFNFFFDSDKVCKLQEGDVLFIDEIHRVREAAAIYLYSAMQDFYMDSGDGEILDIPKITFIGATTDLGMLPSPFRDRFKVRVCLSTYSKESIKEIIKTSSDMDEEVAKEISNRACGIPRIAKSITENTVAYSVANGIEIADTNCVDKVCRLLDIDENGLSGSARRVIKHYQENDNKPMGAMALANTLNISRETMEHEIFPVMFTLDLLQSNGTRGKSLSNKGVIYNAKQ